VPDDVFSVIILTPAKWHGSSSDNPGKPLTIFIFQAQIFSRHEFISHKVLAPLLTGERFIFPSFSRVIR